jgi:hypothetical protein
MNGTSLSLLVTASLVLPYAFAHYIDGVAPNSFKLGERYVNLANSLSMVHVHRHI